MRLKGISLENGQKCRANWFGFQRICQQSSIPSFHLSNVMQLKWSHSRAIYRITTLFTVNQIQHSLALLLSTDRNLCRKRPTPYIFYSIELQTNRLCTFFFSSFCARVHQSIPHKTNYETRYSSKWEKNPHKCRRRKKQM